MATEIRFHLRFSGSPDGTFGGHIGWLYNTEIKYIWRMNMNKANYIKYNYFCDGYGIDNVT